jgi:phosphoglycerate dehydrogenase-like enzyme
MPKILYADNDYPEIDLERALFDPIGVAIVTAQCKTEAQVIAAAGDCCGILLQYAPIGAAVVAALPNLGIVSRIGAGYDTVDTEACAAAGVWVSNSPDYGVGEVATHALALALASIRNIVAYDADVHAGQWHFMSPGTMRRPSELVLGIVGLGRIGKRMAHISRNVFKRVVAYDPHIIDGDFPAYVERAATLAQLAREADVITLHTPLTAETRCMVDAQFFGAVKRGTYFVNTSRGAVVDLPDLLSALEDGTLAGAGLDVLPDEPVPRDSPLLRHRRAILTPHAAF